jgi:deoxyribodipyrimidine photo-lyase
LTSVPEQRITIANDVPPNSQGGFVLYWMIAFRRSRYNFSLQRAVEWATRLGAPIVVLEALRLDYPFASERLHRFIIEGMADNAADFRGLPVLYFPYVEPESGAGKGLLEALAANASVVVTDDYPCFFLPNMVRSAAKKTGVRFEAVDSNGLLPIHEPDRTFVSALQFRRFLQKRFVTDWPAFPAPDPFENEVLPYLKQLPLSIAETWPPADFEALLNKSGIASLPFADDVPRVRERGGAHAAQKRLRDFLEYKLSDYAVLRNDPSQDVASGLSPYLHFGHISAHEVFEALMRREIWTPADLSARTSGQRGGWWRVNTNAEAFLDQLVTWRELGFNMCATDAEFASFESLPSWAKNTLWEHAADPRERVYTLAEFEGARTHDPIWNAAQRQLLRDGTIHNYLRMFWAKKILEWTRNPLDARDIMVRLNNKYALDGRDPNSYSGILWCMGRYDRPWGPERPVFGKVRYMSSKSAAAKFRLTSYLEKYGPAPAQKSIDGGINATV